jgi:hypothetical protein
MIKDIILKFVSKKEREEAGIFDDQGEDQEDTETDEQTIDEDNATALDEVSSTRRAVSSPDIIMDSGDDRVEVVGREMLIALLQKSVLQTVSVPLKLLELLKWKEVATTGAIANTATIQAAAALAKPPAPLRSATLPKTQSSSAPFERKFKKASIVIGAVNYDDDSSDDEEDRVVQKSAVLQQVDSPLQKKQLVLLLPRSVPAAIPAAKPAAKPIDSLSKKPAAVSPRKLPSAKKLPASGGTLTPSGKVSVVSKKRPDSKFAAPSSGATKKAVADSTKQGTVVVQGRAAAFQKKGSVVSVASKKQQVVAQHQASSAKAVQPKVPPSKKLSAGTPASSTKAFQPKVAATRNLPAAVIITVQPLASAAKAVQPKVTATKKLSAVASKTSASVEPSASAVKPVQPKVAATKKFGDESPTAVAKAYQPKEPSAKKSAIVNGTPVSPALAVKPKVPTAQNKSAVIDERASKAVQPKVPPAKKQSAETSASSAHVVQSKGFATKKKSAEASAFSAKPVQPRAAATKSVPSVVNEPPASLAKIAQPKMSPAKKVVGEALASSVRPFARDSSASTKVKPVVARPKVVSTKVSHISSAASPAAAAVAKVPSTHKPYTLLVSPRQKVSHIGGAASQAAAAWKPSTLIVSPDRKASRKNENSAIQQRYQASISLSQEIDDVTVLAPAQLPKQKGISSQAGASAVSARPHVAEKEGSVASDHIQKASQSMLLSATPSTLAATAPIAVDHSENERKDQTHAAPRQDLKGSGASTPKSTKKQATSPACTKPVAESEGDKEQSKSTIPQQQSLPMVPTMKLKFTNSMSTESASENKQSLTYLSMTAAAPMENEKSVSKSLTSAPITPKKQQMPAFSPSKTRAPKSKKRQRTACSSTTAVALPSKKQQVPSSSLTAEVSKASNQQRPTSSPPQALSAESTRPASKMQKLVSSSPVNAPTSEIAASNTSSPIADTPSGQRRVTPLSSEKTPISKAPSTPPTKARKVVDKQSGSGKNDGDPSSPPLLEHSHPVLELGDVLKIEQLQGKQHQQQVTATKKRNTVSPLHRVQERLSVPTVQEGNTKSDYEVCKQIYEKKSTPSKPEAVHELVQDGAEGALTNLVQQNTDTGSKSNPLNSSQEETSHSSQKVHGRSGGSINLSTESLSKTKGNRKELISPSRPKFQARPSVEDIPATRVGKATIGAESPSWPSDSDQPEQKNVALMPGSPVKLLQDDGVIAPSTPKVKDGSAVEKNPQKRARHLLSSLESDNSNESPKGDNARRLAMKTNGANKRKRKAYLMRQLEEHVAPGILSTCHKPKVFPGQLNLKRSQAQEVAGLLLEQLRDQMPQHAEEIPLLYRAREKLKKELPNCVISSDRCERGYYRSHLDADFVDSFQNAMPECIKIKSAVSKKGIAFISTVAATLSHTHYDQDTSFLLMLTGSKEIFYAPPSMGTVLRADHPVISHSSNFEGVSPFVELTGTAWRFAKLNAGDGLLLPQGWLHAVKSLPGTVAISFQIEASGVDAATSPFVRRTRETTPEDIRHLSNIELEQELRAGNAKAGKRNQPPPDAVAKGIANSHLTFKKSLTSITKPAESSRGSNVMPVIPKKGLAMAQKFSRTKHTLTTSSKSPEYKKGFRRGFSKPARPETASLDKVPERATLIPKATEKPFVPLTVGLATRETTGKKCQHDGLRRSSREKLICGVLGCGRDPSMDTSMWVMVLSMDTSEARSASTLPTVPTDHPKHLICTVCCETRKLGVIEPEEVLNKTDRDAIKGWEQYLYYSSSKVDYQKWANHDGKNGKLLQHF